MSKRTSTPWGKPDHMETIAEGIHFFQTPSHGGYLISEDRYQSMPAHLRDIKTFAGGRWYEEDCDWAIVAMAFPKYFADTTVQTAKLVFKACHCKGTDEVFPWGNRSRQGVS